MKKHIFSRCLALFLVIIMTCSVFVSCGNKNSPKNRDHIGEPPPLEQSAEHPDIPEKDYDGYEFTFLCQPNIDGKAYFVDYMVVEGEVSNHILMQEAMK